MVLSNAERQARYREKLKHLAAAGVLSPVQTQILANARERLREWRRSLTAFAEGRMRMRTDNVDTTTEHVAMIRRMIMQDEELLARFDPDGLTLDGNIEIGDVGPQGSGAVFAGRWATYDLDEHGRATNLRLYDAQSPAVAEANMIASRHCGVIAEDMWSISPPGE